MEPSMAPRSPQTTATDTLNPKLNSSTKDREGCKDPKGEVARMSVCQKLMLSSQLWAMEASCSFESFYTVPILQTLGLPMSLVSLTGLIAGPSALLLLPFVGWITDRGSNPRRRKITAMVFASCLLLLGMSLLVVANVLHLMYLMDYAQKLGPGTNHSSELNAPVTAGSAFPYGSITFNASASSAETGVETGTDFPLTTVLSRSSESNNVMKQVSREVLGNGTGRDEATEETREVPFKAALGVLAFVLLDIGFDSINSFSKTFILTCTPRSEHTSVILVGLVLVMASAGGLSTGTLGVVDFTSLFGLSHIKGASLSIQTSAQGVVVLIFVALGLLITLLTGRHQLLIQNQCDGTLNTDIEVTPDNHQQPDDQGARSAWAEAFENSVRSYSSAGIYFDPTLTLRDEAQQRDSEHIPLLIEEDGTSEEKDELLNSNAFSGSASYGTQEFPRRFHHSEQLASTKGTLEDLLEDEVLATERTDTKRRAFGPGGFKAKVACVCIAAYFSVGVMFMFTSNSSDFVGKGIYGGDPEAPPGSDELSRYEQGVKTASIGFLIYYSSYLLISIVHPRVLAFLGYRVEFVMSSTLTALCLLALALTARLEVFFLTAVVAGFQRACAFSVCYAVMNDVMQSMAAQSADGKSKTGLAMSLVSACIPLAYCTLYTLVGPLEDLTGMVSVPLWIGTACCCLSSAAILFLGKI